MNPDPNDTRRLMSDSVFIRRALGFIPQPDDSPFILPSEQQQLDPMSLMNLSLAVGAAEQKGKE